MSQKPNPKRFRLRGFMHSVCESETGFRKTTETCSRDGFTNKFGNCAVVYADCRR